MSGSPWGERDIGFVASNGVATQLFPTTIVTTVSTATYPPSGGGLVKRAVSGRIDQITVESDGTNGGYVEIWDVAGLDRGASNNANDSVSLTDAYIDANGKLLATLQIKPAAGSGHPFGSKLGSIPFDNGLAVRFVGSAGVVKVAPVIEGGFMVQYIAG